MAGILGGNGGGGSGPAPQQPSPPPLEKPQVMPIKDDMVDRQNAIKDLAKARAGKTTRANTIIGSDDSLGDR